MSEWRPQRAVLHLHLLRGGDPGGGVGMDGAASHPHTAHATHASHAAHATHAPGAHSRAHGGGYQGLTLPSLGGGALQHVLGSELMLRVHSHLIHVRQ